MQRYNRQKHSGRKRGAQPNNTNALKHGIYSLYISVQEQVDIENMPLNRNFDELSLARVRLAWCLEKQAAAAPDEWLAFERAILYYLRIIAFFTNRNYSLNMNKQDTSRMDEALRKIRQMTGLPEEK